jgi:hypothetical protein
MPGVFIFTATGEMPERLNGTVSKTVWRFMRHEGSNPSLSAVPVNGLIIICLRILGEQIRQQKLKIKFPCTNLLLCSLGIQYIRRSSRLDVEEVGFDDYFLTSFGSDFIDACTGLKMITI